MPNYRNGKDSTTTLSIPYSYGDVVAGFKYDKDISAQQYAKNVVATYNRYKSGVRAMYDQRFGYNMAINNYQKEYVKYNDTAHYFSDTKVNIYDMNRKEMTIDTLIHYFQTGEPFIIILNLYRLGEDQDLESEIKQWASESSQINNSRELTDEEKICGLSKKNLKIKFDDAKSSAILQN